MRCSGVASAMVLGVSSLLASCSSDKQGISGPFNLELVAPKGVLDDADEVKLEVWDGATCNGPDLVKGAAGAATRVGDTHVLGKTCGGGKQWCATFDVKQDADKRLAWYVEGFASGKRTFRGCTEQAANQAALTVTIRIVKYIEGVICGDSAVGVTETCDPGPGAGDEACDAAACRTQEVVLSNGSKDLQFYKGLPGRKQGVALRWLDDGKLFAAWSDRATGGSGGDGADEITWRRLKAGLLTDDTGASPLQKELRLQSNDSGFTSSGSKRRSGTALTPSIVPVDAGNLLVVFGYKPAGDTPHVYGSIQATNMGKPAAPDIPIGGTTGTQTQPASAASAGGDALVVFVDGTAIKSAFRKSGGTFGAPQTVSASGANLAPRVAWLGSDYVVVWTDGDDIKYRLVGSDGVPKGAEAIANTGRKAGKQDQPDVAGTGSGEFLVVWRSAGGEGDVGTDIRAQRFDASGTAVGTEVNAALSDVNAIGDQSTPVVAGGALGGGTKFYLVAWNDPERGQIAARYLSAAGGFLDNNIAATKSEFDVALSARPLSSPAVAIGGGFCAVAFADDSDGDPAADDDRVRIRRLPLPPPP
jgi:hypothetical protein